MTTRIGWVVDAQHDFLRPDGRLYVHDLTPGATDPGAVTVIPALERTVEWLREHCRVLVFTGDAHRYGDAEIDPVAPDPAAGTYPPHCMALEADPAEQAGAALVPEVAPENPLVLVRDATPEMGRAIAREALATGRAVLVQKDRFSVFEGNAATTAFLDELSQQLGPLEVVVCGVATDVCVTAAVEGIAERRHQVTVVTEAIHGLGLEPPATTMARWRAQGVRTVQAAAEIPERRATRSWVGGGGRVPVRS